MSTEQPAVGASVRVRNSGPEVFTRTPKWAMGRIGRVIESRGRWPDPDRVALGDVDPPQRELLLVMFDHPADPSVTLLADLFEHWLEAP